MSTWLFCTSGAAAVMAGKNRDTSVSGAAIGNWYDYYEGFIEAATRKKWSRASNLDPSISGVLGLGISAGIGKNWINYDMSGYTSRAEASQMILNNDAILFNVIEALKDFNKGGDLKDA